MLKNVRVDFGNRYYLKICVDVLFMLFKLIDHYKSNNIFIKTKHTRFSPNEYFPIGKYNKQEK